MERWRGGVIITLLRDEMSLTDVHIQTEELVLCHKTFICSNTINKLYIYIYTYIYMLPKYLMTLLVYDLSLESLKRHF